MPDPRARAANGSARDRRLRLLKVALPMAIGAIGAAMVVTPLLDRKEVGFVLDKDKVATAPERLRVDAATYRGTDDRGRPFAVAAGGAVQASSQSRNVAMTDLAATMTLKDGPARIAADTATYDTDAERIAVPGAVDVAAPGGYRLTTRDVGIDMKTRRVTGSGRVEGDVPLGRFSGDTMRADLDARTVVVEGRARLHIRQGGARSTP